MAILLAFAAFFLLIGLVYVVITLALIPGMADERLGRLEELPDNAGEWRDDVESPAGRAARDAGVTRQIRLWIDMNRDWLGRERILKQVRYIDDNGRLVRTEPDRRYKRKRIRS